MVSSSSKNKMMMMMSSSSRHNEKDQLFHILHKVPQGDTPYVKAKHAQLVEKDPEAAIVLFWKAINAGDRVESALKDMAVVMKQLNRTEEAIEAIKSFRGRCPKQAQESLDNVLIDLYKGNLGWAYMQKSNYLTAEVVYRKAQMIDPDANKACSLGICLIKQGRYYDARLVLEEISQRKIPGSEEIRARNRAAELLMEINTFEPPPSDVSDILGLDDDFLNGLQLLMNEWGPARSKRLPIFEEISSFRDQLAC
ncbi:hypothetical protein ERO13_D07G162200v2 [Gossypium hirsutum]|uniref:Protein SULFUR DEFICIENCY-INDUCED 1 n=1 Tax=Gossypium raimondii TaxID=29730 RepID=A0A0D2M0D2_GOSRA|nr:hypothetical protein ERO13_D07G162200v2 [Gossypium hirsutum]KJB10137.1 hypothetical protein B456_001G185700 [Gossypium raimondii]